MKNIRTDIESVIKETKQFYMSDKLGMALIQVKSIAEIKKEQLNLASYYFPDGMYRYLDECAQRDIAYWKKRISVKDHQIPALGPWYGIAEHSAFLGGEVEYSPNTSWHHPCLETLDDLSGLKVNEENPIFKMVIDGIKYIKERYGDMFVPMVRGTSGVLEIANTLRGNAFFYDFYESPKALKKLCEFIAEAIIWYYNKQLDAAGECKGGIVTGFGEWLPGRAIGHMSEDTTTMISLEQFEEFGKPYTQRICEAFECGFIHTHALSEHCLSSISKIEGIKTMEISSDPNTERAIEVYKRWRDQIDAIPVLNLTREEIMNHMDMLKTQKTIIWYEATTVKEACEVSEMIRQELPVQ